MSVDPIPPNDGTVARRMLLVHAHPDDETITTGGTIARYAAAGVEVTVLTCTLGEEGEVIGAQWAGLTADAADQLGGYRVLELTRALAALGAAGPRFLGGAGRWRDSGMAGTPAAANPRAFVNADADEVVGELVAVIRELRPHVVVCYDEVGGYGHPDHIRAHRICTDALALAGSDEDPDRGAPWDPAKFYWTVTDAAALAAAQAGITEVPRGWRRPEPGEIWTVDPAVVTTAIDVSEVYLAKSNALRAHATQVTVAHSGTEYALSNNIIAPILREEQFVLVSGQLGPVDAAGRETDLFAGIAEPAR
ncbi:N-acetyl-1-D-myo-inositol-2-amino-2-deoxy-alpha-D-glucopyranoside deacetylase [Aldersonia sp. NBC_00410]|uniref:N-acetyl-1-D-myo-inositol-2-amino-2-deoxy-alpha- D-glucopyranoside deacetylase n=1 Tax=Aldersonia sp. NBC_00410 TaxID=2975954 RepID=UPI00225A4C6E|nr:N-acetyl-1-D-myo-inositol-2-amino-2-deoxy-alpha-D-glucopyranoside deacetylase [Aldersonia sp. NBC_00410]MCX5043789.1 N-acetyl-1-D-myo-inositol-2-amino-2-deoxy-alpha-D-glucopyranoside deacetylase [Aldersonia sp. NBC_00410]